MFQTYTAQQRPNEILLSQQHAVCMLHLVTRIEKSLKCSRNIPLETYGFPEVFNNILTMSVLYFMVFFISCGVSLVVIQYSLREICSCGNQ